MNNFLHTLTAYHLRFSYMKRNNPLHDKLADKIKNDERPKIVLSEIFEEMIKLTNNHQYSSLVNSGKIILLNKIEEVYDIDSNKKRIFIIPKAGKINIPIQMVNMNNDKIYNFGSDWASTYPHNVFIYKISGEYYVVCHRNGGSGCKTILCSALNQLLKLRGIKVEMNWMPPIVNDSYPNYDVEKISLIYEEDKSSDIADEPARKIKRTTIKELTLSLKTGKFDYIYNLIHKHQLKEISKEETFSKIKSEVKDDSFNNAFLTVRIGKAKKKVAWDDLEGLIDGFDITDKVSKTGTNFIPTLKQCSDEFLLKLLENK